jgi:hypothetical protein
MSKSIRPEDEVRKGNIGHNAYVGGALIAGKPGTPMAQYTNDPEHDMNEMVDEITRLEAVITRLRASLEPLEMVAAWAAEYRRISESGSNVTASVWHQLTTALDALEAPT